MKKILSTIIIGLMLLTTASAQGLLESERLFYHSFRTPQSTALNPSFFPYRNSFYLTLPGLSTTFCSPIAISDAAHYDAERQVTVLDANSLLDALCTNKNLFLGVNADILGFGFRVKHASITFSSRVISYANVGVPAGLLQFATEGNVNENNEVIEKLELLDGNLISANAYLENGIGFAYEIPELHLTVGARAKLLYGIANAYSEGTYVNLRTDEEGNSLGADIYYRLQGAACVPFDTNFNPITDGWKPFDHANTGMSFDLGAKYDMGPFTFSASLLDIGGGINWQHNVVSIVPENGQESIHFDGIDLTELVQDGQLNFDTIGNYYLAQLDSLTPVRKDGESYHYGIPTKLNLGASYDFLKLLRAGLLFQGQFDRTLLSQNGESVAKIDHPFRCNTTLSLGVNLFTHAELIVANSMVYDGAKASFFNPGFGISAGSVIQFYFMVNRLSSIYLVDMKDFNIHFGLNILIGKPKPEGIIPALLEE